MGLELEAQLGLLLFPTCAGISLGRCCFAHTQPNSVLSPTAPAAAATGESLTNMHCINATIGMSSSSRELSNIYNQSDHRLPNWDYQSKPMYEDKEGVYLKITMVTGQFEQLNESGTSEV